MARRGRPSFEPTIGQREQVEQMVSVGMTRAEMASVIGISEPTLNLHFEDELTHGLARKRAHVMELLFRSAASGNVSAQKHLEAVTGRASAEAAFTGEEKTRGAKPGKKEEAAQAATTAGQGTGWGDDLQPDGALN